MAQHTDDISADIPDDILRLTVPEAAQALGISPEAVRNRLSRNTLDSVKVEGTVYVLLQADRVRHIDDTPNDRPRYASDTPNNRSRHIGDMPGNISDESAALISAKDETIRVLAHQLEAEREANAEMRRIVAGLVQRVPQLEAPADASESPVSASEAPGSSPTPPDQEKRSWLARFFGL
jgi:DNA-binding Lrp family transcriptional regulator